MPNLIADKIMQYVNRIGEPVKSTSTTTQEEAPGIDLGNIMMMLYLTNAFKKPGGTTGIDSLPGSSMASNALLGGLSSQAPGSFAGQPFAQGGLGGGPASGGLEGMDMQKILEILKSLGGLIR